MGWDEGRQLAVVADGMGGYSSGDLASRLVRDTILHPDAPLDLAQAVLQAHSAILAHVAAHPEHAGMGSTLVVARIVGRECRIAWVGDSRIYLWRRRVLLALTRDHSMAEFLRVEENMTDTELRVHPLRNRVLQSLGVDTPVPAVATVPLQHGDWIVLCTDGLTGELDDGDIQQRWCYWNTPARVVSLGLLSATNVL
jgi:protein phosphatase